MMAPLAATCIAIVIIVSVIVALGMAAECLWLLVGRWLPAPAGSRWPSVLLARVRSKASLACRRHEYEDGQRPAAEHDPGYVPVRADHTADAPRSAEILPFVRKPARGRRAWQDSLPPDDAA